MKKKATYKDLISAVTLLEGKKKQISIAQVKEVLKALKTVVRKDLGLAHVLLKYLLGEK